MLFPGETFKIFHELCDNKGPTLTLIKLKNEEIIGGFTPISWDCSSNWKNDIRFEYKKYPSLLYFLFKNPGCEAELRNFLSKADSIKDKDTDKFPTFLLILRIFSDLNCLDLQFNTENYFGTLIKEEIILGI